MVEVKKKVYVADVDSTYNRVTLNACSVQMSINNIGFQFVARIKACSISYNKLNEHVFLELIHI